jgi:hypothetical protein
LVDGKDVDLVSRWLEHKDGGTLAMKTYGHLRLEHYCSGAEGQLRGGCDKES